MLTFVVIFHPYFLKSRDVKWYLLDILYCHWELATLKQKLIKAPVLLQIFAKLVFACEINKYRKGAGIIFSHFSYSTLKMI